MARVELPQSRLKARKRQRRVRVILVVLAVVIILTGLLAWGSHAPFLRITAITISGQETLASTTLQDFVEQEISGSYGYIFAKDNILLYPRQKIAQDLPAHFPEIKAADVHAADFHTVAVSVVEREPTALYCGDSASSTDCYLMDETGAIYAPAAAGEDQVYVSYMGAATSTGGSVQQYLTPQAFQSLSALADTLAQVSTSTGALRQIAVDDNGDARAYFSAQGGPPSGGQNFLLMFSTKDAGGDVFERFTLALKSDPFTAHPLSDFEYLDLRFGDKLYYKLR